MKLTPLPMSLAEWLSKAVPALVALLLITHPAQAIEIESATGIVAGPGLTIVTPEPLAPWTGKTDAVRFGPPLPPTEQQVLMEVCKAKGYGIDCGKTLLGMLWKESRNDAKAIGDFGQARGYFQIHYRLHHVSIACTEDLRCSAEWTLSYLESNGYPKYPTYAIQCHNGCNINNGYAASVRRNGALLWDTDVKQSVIAVAAR